MFTKLLNKALSLPIQHIRPLSLNPIKEKLLSQERIRAWQVHSYGDINELQDTTIRIPLVQNPEELLISVEAASVNPIDLLMMGGYGRTIFQIPRNFQMELPLTLGRDFSGTIMHKGLTVGNDLNVGDKVYGFMPLHKQGSFQEAITVPKTHICRQPPNLSPLQSTSLVYAAMTAWSALYLFGNLSFKQIPGMKILILGASGGVGTVAVQLLKSQGATVFGTCSTDAVPLVEALKADCVFDYKDPEYLNKVAEEGFYDIILDCAKFGFENVPKNWNFDTYISLNSPLMKNTDQYGLIGGLFASANTLLRNNLTIGRGKSLKWGFFMPSSTGFAFINQLICEGKISPQIHKEFTYDELPEAFKEVRKGHLRGKVVIKY